MTLFSNLQSLTGALYEDCLYNKDLLGTYYLAHARDEGVRLPTGDQPDEWVYFGAKVFDSRAGINEHVVYLDLASLYPSTILGLNISPETLVGTEQDLQDSPYDESDCVWSYIDPRPVKHVDSDTSDWQAFTDGTYKIVYDDDQNNYQWRDDPQYERCFFLDRGVQEGFVTSTVQDLIDFKYQYEGSMYEAVKRVVNSVYGYMAYGTQRTSSRLYDWRLGEAVTLAGRIIINRTRDVALAMARDRGYDAAFISHGDTDGVGIALPSARSTDEALAFARDVAERLNETGYDELFRGRFGVDTDEYDTHMAVEVESHSRRVLIPERDPDPHRDNTEGVQKRRVEWVTWDEGDTVDEVSITGLEAVRSDVAQVTTDLQRDVCATIVRRGLTEDVRATVCDQLHDVYTDVVNGEYPLSDVATRGGIGQPLSAYGTDSRRPGPLVRGAKYANEHVDGVTIREGDKPLLFHVDRVGGDLPDTYSADTAEDGTVVDAIAVPTASALPDSISVDYEEHAQRYVVDPLQPILATVGIPIDDAIRGDTQASLAAW